VTRPDRSESVRRFFVGIAAVTRVIRAREELSQAEVARRAGISPRLVSDVERERANPTSIHLDQLARGLGLGGIPELTALAEEAVDRLVASTIRPTD
jgi:transcriptional regulator with XRE-family HTH domain